MYLDMFLPRQVIVGYGSLGVRGELGYEGGRVSYGNHLFQNALSTHAPARVSFELNGRFSTFHAGVALNGDVPMGASSANFQILVDGKQVASATEVVAGELPRLLEADIAGARTLELVVSTKRFDCCHSVWLEPIVVPPGHASVPNALFRRPGNGYCNAARHSRHSLIPMVPPAAIYQQQHLPVQYDLKRDGRLSLIKEYSSRLADWVICWIEDARAIERVASETGKQVIPVMTMETVPVFDESRPATASELSPAPVQNVRAYVPSPRYAEYLSFLERNINSFPYVLLGNATLEIYGGYDSNRSWFDFVGTLLEIDGRFPALARKAMYGPVDIMIERDAWRHHQLNTDRMANEIMTPSKYYLLQRKVPLVIFTGFTYLYASAEELDRDGYSAKLPGEYSFLHHERGPFPYSYLKPYCDGLSIYSGIGFYSGAARHNLSRLKELGLSGCVFFVPQCDDEQGHAQMDKYLTDIASE